MLHRTQIPQEKAD